MTSKNLIFFLILSTLKMSSTSVTPTDYSLITKIMMHMTMAMSTMETILIPIMSNQLGMGPLTTHSQFVTKNTISMWTDQSDMNSMATKMSKIIMITTMIITISII